MNDFNERFAKSAGNFAYIRFLSAKIDASKLKVTVSAVYDKENEARFTKEKAQILEELKKLLPPSARVELSATAISRTPSEIVRTVLDYLSKESIFVYSSINKEDITAIAGDNPIVRLRVSESIGEYMEMNGLVEKLRSYLSNSMLAEFTVKLEKRSEDMAEVIERLSAETYRPRFTYERPDEGRTIDPRGRTPMCGNIITEKARYISDCIRPDYVTLYGTMSDVKEHEYTPKNAKNEEKRKYVTFFLDDTTGKIRCVFFVRQKSESVLKYLQNGAYIIANGNLDYDARLNDGSMQFNVRRFTGCDKADFVPNKVVRLVDDKYRFVTPVKYTYRTQDSIYAEQKAPLTDEPIVIFETLTTSRHLAAFGELVEIGAAKIRDGRIIETFGTFIRPLGEVSEEVRTNLGIRLSDITGKPSFDEALPDFFKFFDGYTLTAFPYDFHMKVLGTYLDKLHIPMPSTVDMANYTDKATLKSARQKSTGRTVGAAIALAKILTNT